MSGRWFVRSLQIIANESLKKKFLASSETQFATHVTDGVCCTRQNGWRGTRTCLHLRRTELLALRQQFDTATASKVRHESSVEKVEAQAEESRSLLVAYHGVWMAGQSCDCDTLPEQIVSAMLSALPLKDDVASVKEMQVQHAEEI